jgi:hypothetical protein
VIKKSTRPAWVLLAVGGLLLAATVLARGSGVALALAGLSAVALIANLITYIWLGKPSGGKAAAFAALTLAGAFLAAALGFLAYLGDLGGPTFA